MWLNFFNKTEVAYRRMNKHKAIFQEIAQRLLERLRIIKLKPQQILDLTLNFPYTVSELTNHYQEAQTIVVSTNEIALEYVKRGKQTKNTELLCCSSFEAIPLSNHSVDIIVANLLLPWINDHGAFLKEIKRLLKPGGLFIFSSLGPDTLKELSDYLSEPSDVIGQGKLLDMHILGDLLMQTGLSEPVIEMEMLQVKYPRFSKMVKELSVLNLLSTTKTLSVKPLLKEFNLTFEIIYGHAWQFLQQQKPDTGEVFISVDKIIRR